MKRNKGISLIVLVITIIVIIILAGAVILSLSNNNPIASATQATFKSTVESYNSELTMAMSNMYITNNLFDKTGFNAGAWDGVSTGTGTIKEFITSMKATDGPKFKIQAGNLVYVGSDVTEQGYMTDMGLLIKQALGIGNIATVNSTVDGKIQSFSNPIIPVGFKAINDVAI